jgi:hypothetical protein
MDLENFMLSEISQVKKNKGQMFSLICESYTYKSNVYIETYIIIHICIYIYTYTERERERERQREQNCIYESV